MKKSQPWAISEWQQKLMTPEALELAKTLAIEGAAIDDDLKANEENLATLQKRVDNLKLIKSAKYQAFTKECQTYRPEVFKAIEAHTEPTYRAYE